MEKPEETQIKGQVNHRLQFIGKNKLAFVLLKHCVLQGIKGAPSSSEVIKTLFLQRHLRYQHYSLIKADPSKCLKLHYSMNCPPAGFKSVPLTRACKRARTCPWCYVRRWLLPAFKALMLVPAELRTTCSVIGWKRVILKKDKSLFFRANYGPHQWCKALVTIQFAVPWPNCTTGELFYYHFGVQIVPGTCDYKAALTRRAVKTPLEINGLHGATVKNIILIMSSVATLPWLELFQPQQFKIFYDFVLAPKTKSVRLFRINPYHP